MALAIDFINRRDPSNKMRRHSPVTAKEGQDNAVLSGYITAKGHFMDSLLLKRRSSSVWKVSES